MAKNLTFNEGNLNISNITEYPNSFKRQGAFPLERFSVFNTIAALQDYAANNPIAYVGQILTLVDETNKTVIAYVISNTEGTLIKLATTAQSGDLAADVDTLKTQVAALIERVGKLGDLADKDKIGNGDLTEDLLKLINGKADKATTLEGYGIEDAYTKDAADKKFADKATTLKGYGITDAYTKTEVDTKIDKKADKATTLAGYGITDAYTKDEVNSKISTAYKVKGSLNPNSSASSFVNKFSIGMPENGDVYNISENSETGLGNSIMYDSTVSPLPKAVYSSSEAYGILTFEDETVVKQIGNCSLSIYTSPLGVSNEITLESVIALSETTVKVALNSNLTDGTTYYLGAIQRDRISVTKGDNVVWVDGYGWDKLASDIDLSGYYKKTEIDPLLANKQDKANLSTDIITDADSDVKYPSVKAVKTELDNKVSKKDVGYSESDSEISYDFASVANPKTKTSVIKTNKIETSNIIGTGSAVFNDTVTVKDDFDKIRYSTFDRESAQTTYTTLKDELDKKVDNTSDKLLTEDDKNILNSFVYTDVSGETTLSTNTTNLDFSSSNVNAGHISANGIDVSVELEVVGSSETKLFNGIVSSYKDSKGQYKTKNLQAVLDDKVDKVAGKQLSKNDYTDDDKNAVTALGHTTSGGFSISDTVAITENSHLQVNSEAQFGNTIVMNKTGVSDFSNIQYIDQSNENAVSLQSVLDKKIGNDTIATDTNLGLVKSAPTSDKTKNKVVVDSTTGIMSVENVSADTINGAVATAEKLETARTISITGAVTGNGSFDGSKDVSINVALPNTGKEGTYVKVTTDAQGRVTAGEEKLATTDISGLGDIVSHDVSEFATATQGGLADSAVQEIKIAGITYKKGSSEITKANLQKKLNFADKVATNTFTEDNTFNKNVEIKGHVTLADLNLSDANVDSYAVNKKYVDEEITKKISASDSMVYRGTLGTGGTITELPTQNVITGDTYKVITNGTYAGQSAFAGDLFIALVTTKTTADGEATSIEWTYIPSGDDGNVSAKENNLLGSGKLIIGQGNHEIKALDNGNQGDVLKIKKSGNPGYVKADTHIAAEGSIIEITKTVDESTEAITYTYDVPNVPVDKLVNSTQENFVLVLDGGNAAGFSA